MRVYIFMYIYVYICVYTYICPDIYIKTVRCIYMKATSEFLSVRWCLFFVSRSQKSCNSSEGLSEPDAITVPHITVVLLAHLVAMEL